MAESLGKSSDVLVYSSESSVFVRKVLMSLGYIDESVYIRKYMLEKRNGMLRFLIDVLISGTLIHVSLIWAYVLLYTLLGTSISMGLHVPLIISYGLFHHFFLGWIPLRRK